MAKHENLTALFTAIADSIRNKTGGTGAIIADDFPEAIDGIQTGGGVDKIQRYIELNGSAMYLFSYFQGTSIGELMDGVDLSNIDNMSYMFHRASKLTSVPAIDIRSASNVNNMLGYCSELTECWIRNIKAPLHVSNGTSWGTLLTLESLLHLCKECRNVNTARNLTMGTANIAKLEGIYVKLIDITDDMRAEDDLIDEKYPFVQCESTDEGAMTIQDYMATKMWSLA